MATIRAKTFEFSAALDPDGRLVAAGEPPARLPRAWTPEHLLLAAVARCTLKSLAHHAGRAGVQSTGSARMRCVVTKPGGEERYRTVELAVELDVRLEPEPDPAATAELLTRAERDCFVGNSLAVEPVYAWRVNGRSPARS